MHSSAFVSIRQHSSAFVARRPRNFRMTQLDPRSRSGGPTVRDTGTAETDENYDLVSMLYHCLKAADAYSQYIADAEDAGDDELLEFFEKARKLQNQLAGEARALLAERLADATNDEES
jgi:spore coat polysaccharide biosynthesis protein SpsF (cytidylyltransferase family)